MKKLLYIFLVIILVVSLTSCNKETAYTLSERCLREAKNNYTETEIKHLFASEVTEIQAERWDEENQQKDEIYVYAYIITIYRDTYEQENGDMAIDYWICYIISDSMNGIRRENDIIALDCDWYKTEIIPSHGLIIEEGKSK